MRYAKGSIRLSESQDYPLLRQVLRCGYVTPNQLYDFMNLTHHEWSRPSFHWRVRRLLDRGLVVQRPAPGGESVFSIGANGALILQGRGEYCLIGPRRLGSNNGEFSILHAVELNEIHLSLLRSGLPATWTPASEVRSQNELSDFGYVKDYDAVVWVKWADGEIRFALEYERSAKAAKHYQAIASLLKRESRVSHVLYLVSNYDLLSYVKKFFGQAAVGVYFGVVRDWHAHLLEMPVSVASTPVSWPLCQALQPPKSARSSA